MNYSKMTPNELAEEFIKLGTENGITMLNGDYRRGNRIVKQMNKLTDSIKDDSELFKFVLKCAMRSDDRQARGIGAAKALQNDIGCVSKPKSMQVSCVPLAKCVQIWHNIANPNKGVAQYGKTI